MRAYQADITKTTARGPCAISVFGSPGDCAGSQLDRLSQEANGQSGWRCLCIRGQADDAADDLGKTKSGLGAGDKVHGRWSPWSPLDAAPSMISPSSFVPGIRPTRRSFAHPPSPNDCESLIMVPPAAANPQCRLVLVSCAAPDIPLV